MQACHLAATDLACRRGDRVLFSGLSFVLQPGSALHVTGPNGVGKSSLLRTLAGLLLPWAGDVERDGMAGLLDEHPALDVHQPLGDALRFWNRIDRASGEDALERLGLQSLAAVPVRYLSTGQRKRAALVRLLSQDAPIWLLDEPLNGLDRDSLATVEGLISGHCNAGGIAVVASHQPFRGAGVEQLALESFAR